MPEFSDIIQALWNHERELEAQLAKVRAARENLQSVGTTSSTSQAAQPRTRGRSGHLAGAGTAGGGGKRRKTFSAATRAKMAAAQRARWAKKKKDSEARK